MSDIVIRIPREVVEQQLGAKQESCGYYGPTNNPLVNRRAWADLCRDAKKDGRFKAVKIGRTWLAWKASFDQWLEEQADNVEAAESHVDDLFKSVGVRSKRVA